MTAGAMDMTFAAENDSELVCNRPSDENAQAAACGGGGWEIVSVCFVSFVFVLVAGALSFRMIS